MGTWGVGIFSDDAACDIRDAYRELLEDGVDDAEATRRTLDRFEKLLSDPDDGPILWIAFAVTQSKLGRLESEVRGRALAMLDGGADLERWREDSKLVAKRRAALDAARAQLTGAQPKRRRVRPPKKRLCGLRAGDLLVLGLGDSLGLVRVLDVRDSRIVETPILEAYVHRGTELPSLTELERLSPLRMSLADDNETHFDAFDMNGVNWEGAGFRKVAQLAVRADDSELPFPSVGKSWASLAEYLKSMT